MGILLSGEEITEVSRAVLEDVCNKGELVEFAPRAEKAVAKAQLKKVVEWLQKEVLDECDEEYNNVQCFPKKAMQALLKEIE